MTLMHTRLPEFYEKVDAGGKRLRPETEVVLRGLENLKTAKLASLRVGRVENEIVEITQDPEVTKVEVIVTDRMPETSHTVIIKGYHKDGTCKKAILENMYISVPGVECELYDVHEVDDRRPPLEPVVKY